MMKKITLIRRLAIGVCTLIASTIWAQGNTQKELYLNLESDTKISDRGLFFGDFFQFGPRITPYGDCIDVVNGYAFVTWYRGGMDDRSLMLSRKNLNEPNSEWVSIEFPHDHYGFRFDRSLGDSHNTIAVGISTFDNRVHMIYDMHAYSESNIPNDFFNYSVSEAGGAFVPDSDFNLSLFENSNTTNAKFNYLKQGENYNLLSYPEIHRAPDGSLVVSYRFGGAGNGDQLLAHYDQNGWTDNWVLSRGRTSSPTYSMYGYSKFQFGTYYTGFAIRDYQSKDYNLNQGLYFTYANSTPTGPSTVWKDAYGNSINIPFASDVENIKIGMPQDDYNNDSFPRTPSNPAFVVTESGAVHFLARGGNTNTHYYKNAGDTQFTSTSQGVPYTGIRGDIFSYLDNVFIVGLNAGKLLIRYTKEGTSDWKIAYEGESNGLNYKYSEAIVDGDKLYVYLMEVGTSESLPLHFKVFTLSDEETIEVPEFTIEAEDFTSGSGTYTVGENANASAGSHISGFSGDASLTYTFNLDDYASATPGVYDLKVVASNANRSDSTMEIVVNGDSFTLPITRTFDYDVFEKSTLMNIELVDGENTIVMNQQLAFSSRPDLLEFHQRSTLSSDEFTKSDVVIYPNPSNGVFNIESSLTTPDYKVISIQGKILRTGVLSSKKLNLSTYSKGVYFLQLSSDSKSVVKKIVIK
jgi:hypothetical protein